MRTQHYQKCFEGCNHSLSAKAIQAAEEMTDAHGNAPFDPSFYNKAVVDELMNEGFLTSKGSGVRRNKIIIGKPPMPKVKG